MAQAPDREKALELAMAENEKSYGKGSVMRIGDEVRQPIAVIPTGSIALDIGLGIGGLPRGRSVETDDPESSGKTTLVRSWMLQQDRRGPLLAVKLHELLVHLRLVAGVLLLDLLGPGRQLAHLAHGDLALLGDRVEDQPHEEDQDDDDDAVVVDDGVHRLHDGQDGEGQRVDDARGAAAAHEIDGLDESEPLVEFVFVEEALVFGPEIELEVVRAGAVWLSGGSERRRRY